MTVITLKEMLLAETSPSNTGGETLAGHAAKMAGHLEAANHVHKIIGKFGHGEDQDHSVDHHSADEGLRMSHDTDIGTQHSEVHKALTSAGFQPKKTLGTRARSKFEDQHYAGVHGGHHITVSVSPHEKDYMKDHSDDMSAEDQSHSPNAIHQRDPFIGAIHTRIHPK